MADLPDVDAVVDEFKRPVGPLPLAAWFGLGAVGVVGVVLWRRRRAGASSPDAPAGDDVGSGTDAPIGQGGYLPGGFVIAPGPTSGTGAGVTPDPFPVTTPVYTTNSDWSGAAARWAIGRGFPPTLVTDQLARYLGGQALTTQGRNIIDAALVAIGPPPQPVPPPLTPPDQAPPTDSSPPTDGMTLTNAMLPAGYTVVDSRGIVRDTAGRNWQAFFKSDGSVGIGQPIY